LIISLHELNFPLDLIDDICILGFHFLYTIRNITPESICELRTGKLLTLTEPADLCRAFHYYRKDRSKNPIPKHPELERLLNEEFRTMADFRRAKERLALEAKEKESASSQESTSEKTPNAPPVSS
jgi:hypothetical protein